MDRERLEQLFDKYLGGALTPDERSSLADELAHHDGQRAFAEYVQFSSMIARAAAPAEESPETVQYAEAASARHSRVVRRRSRARVLPAAVAAAALAVAAAIVMALSPLGDEAPPAGAELAFTSVFGDVRTTAHADAPRTGTTVPTGSRITTPPDGRAALRFADGTTVEIDPGTTLTVSAVAPKGLALERGSLEAAVAPQPAAAPMVVETADARVEVVGTKFTAVADEDGSGVEVESGRVRIVRVADGAAVTVDAGRSCIVAEGADFKPIRLKVRALLSVARASRTYDETTTLTVRLARGGGAPAMPPLDTDEPEAVAPGALTDGLLARFGFDEGAGDRFASSVEIGPLARVAGRVETSDDRGAYYSWVPGRHGTALRFTPAWGKSREDDRGAGGVVPVPRKDNVVFLRGDHSIAAWVKFDAEQHRDAVTTIMIQPGWINGLTRFGDRAVMAIFDADKRLPAAGWNSPVTLRAWHHVVGVMDTRTAKLHLYADGRLRETAPYAPPAPRQGASLWLIGGKQGGAAPTECTVDELRVYNRVLTPAEVRALYRWTPGAAE